MKYVDSFGWQFDLRTECDDCHCVLPCCTYYDPPDVGWDYCQKCWRVRCEDGRLEMYYESPTNIGGVDEGRGFDQ